MNQNISAEQEKINPIGISRFVALLITNFVWAIVQIFAVVLSIITRNSNAWVFVFSMIVFWITPVIIIFSVVYSIVNIIRMPKNKLKAIVFCLTNLLVNPIVVLTVMLVHYIWWFV